MGNITHFVKTAKGGVLYKDAAGAVVGAGSPMDRAAPDVTNEYGIIIFSGANDNTYYSVANEDIDIILETPDGTTTGPLSRQTVLTALSESFFFLGNGETAIIDANNGLSLDGTTVQLGGALIKNTTITENGYQAIQTRLETVESELMSVSHYTENNDPFLSGTPGYSRLLGVASATGNAYCAVWSNNLDDPTAYLRAEVGDWQSGIDVRPTSILLRAIEGSATASLFHLAGYNIISEATAIQFSAAAFRLFSDKVEQQISGKYIFGESATDGSFRIGVSPDGYTIEKLVASQWEFLNSTDQNKRIEQINANTSLIKLPVLLDVTGTATVDLVTFAMSNESQAAFNMNVNIKKTGVAGGGYIQSLGSASRNAGGVLSLNTGAPNTIAQESITGNYSVSMAAVAGDFIIRIAQTNGTKSRVEGFIEFLVTNIPDTF